MTYYHNWKLQDPPYVGTTTFKCDGCGKRFPREAFWEKGRNKKLHSLDGGNFAASSNVIYSMTCSKRCSSVTPQRTVKQLRDFLGLLPIKAGFYR